MKTKYWAAARESTTGPGWLAWVYHWDESGNRERTDYSGTTLYRSKEQAIDSAVEWAEEHGWEFEIDFGDH